MKDDSMHRQACPALPKDKVDLPVLYTLHAEGKFTNSLANDVTEVVSDFWSNFSY